MRPADLNGVRKLTAASVMELARHCRLLSALTVSSCPLIGAQHLSAAARLLGLSPGGVPGALADRATPAPRAAPRGARKPPVPRRAGMKEIIASFIFITGCRVPARPLLALADALLGRGPAPALVPGAWGPAAAAAGRPWAWPRAGT